MAPLKPCGELTARDGYRYFIGSLGLEAKEKDSLTLNREYQGWMGLRDDEVTQMLNIALLGDQQYESKEQEMAQAARVWREKYTPLERRAHVQEADPSIMRLHNEGEALLDQTIGSLKAALGQEAFSKLDHFVQGTWGNQQRKKTPAPPPPGFLDPAATRPGSL